MFVVNGDYHSEDRWVLDVSKMEPGEPRRKFKPVGTAYVMLRNASFLSHDTKLAGVTAVLTTTEPFQITTGEGWAAVVDFHGLKQHEATSFRVDPKQWGSLSYMDGGTNSTAISPMRNGEPVVNFVHFPSGMVQTQHVHPSHRIGFCLMGEGRTDLPKSDPATIKLKEGDLFFMGRMELHHFITEDKPCVLFVFAPDSDTGPTDEKNPLKERTYIPPK